VQWCAVEAAQEMVEAVVEVACLDGRGAVPLPDLLREKGTGPTWVRSTVCGVPVLRGVTVTDTQVTVRLAPTEHAPLPHVSTVTVVLRRATHRSPVPFAPSDATAAGRSRQFHARTRRHA